MSKKRILWIDIYKALAILLVVIGHATGLFNLYIYQFHLAAFFFISGYVVRQNNEDFFEILLKRVYTIILPLIVFVIVNALAMDFMNRIGIYDDVFGDYQYIGLFNIIKNFCLYGSLYAWLLGAAWFLIVLFGVALISSFLYSVSIRKLCLYVMYSSIIYVLGYYYIENIGVNLPFYFDLMFVAQFFYCFGFVIKEKYADKLSDINIKISIALFLCALFLMYKFSRVPNCTIDYGARSFDNIVLNTITSFNGIVFLYSLAQLLQKTKNTRILSFFCMLGQNTLAVVLLHFIYFKVAYIILYMVRVIPWEDVSLITPRYDVGKAYWWFITGISVWLSIVTWYALKKHGKIAMLLGLDKEVYNVFENKIRSSIIFAKYYSIKEKVLRRIGRFRKYFSMIVLLIGVAILGALTVRDAYVKNSDIHITFPCDYSNVIFSEGWLEQGNEDYRWIASEGMITLETNCENKVIIEGYVPEEFSEIRTLKVYINEHFMEEIDVKENASFVLEYNIEGLNIKQQINIRFLFDGVHMPSENDTDVRQLSGLINRISIE